MKAAICCGGSSLWEKLPFDTSPFDVVVAVNDAALLVPHTHWAAFDKNGGDFRRKFPQWQEVDWDGGFLTGVSTSFNRRPKYTFPLALETVQRIYKPEEIHCFGVDFSGKRVDGFIDSGNRWEEEEEQVRRLDLSKVTWHGRWRP